MLFALDQAWRFTYINQQAERFLDRIPGDLGGKVIWEMYPGLVDSEFERAYRQSASERVACSLTSFYPDHDRWYEVYVYPTLNGIAVYFSNVTERMRAEKTLRCSEERSYINRRVDEPKYQRLTFALLGVATPSDLIADKTQTPFNIGSAIALQGFQLHEVQPLTDGLTGKVSNPQDAIAQILDWTGGQPFLTQKLCKLMVEESAWGNSPSVEQVVKSRIIENWESQDEPEHLRTIRDRILRNEQKAGQLLGLYQQILTPPNPSYQGGGNLKPPSLPKEENLLPPFLRGVGGIAADGSPEQTELRLSGLVVQQQGKLQVYNRIYQQVFNQAWVEKQLEKLRPYSQIFNAWVASGFQDESRLLRGQALQDALSWSNNQSLSPLDYRFLGASQDLDKREVQQALAVK